MSLQERSARFVKLIVLCTSLVPFVDCKYVIVTSALATPAIKEQFPFMCSLIFDNQYFGACTIIQRNYVVTAVSHLLRDGVKRDKRFYSYMSVFAGSIAMNPTIFTGSVPSSQERKVIGIYVNPDFSKNETVTVNERTRLDQKLVFDVVNVAFNIAFLKVHDFELTSSVQPIYLNFYDLNDFTAQINNRVFLWEIHPFDNVSCRIASWHQPTNRKVYHYVFYSSKAACRQAYCNYNTRACRKFPVEDYHMCFDPAYFGGPCPMDLGSALYCRNNELGLRMMGILTTSLFCGQESLPRVFTTMSSIMTAFRRVIGKDYVIDRDVQPY